MPVEGIWSAISAIATLIITLLSTYHKWGKVKKKVDDTRALSKSLYKLIHEIDKDIEDDSISREEAKRSWKKGKEVIEDFLELIGEKSSRQK